MQLSSEMWCVRDGRMHTAVEQGGSEGWGRWAWSVWTVGWTKLEEVGQ